MVRDLYKRRNFRGGIDFVLPIGRLPWMMGWLNLSEPALSWPRASGNDPSKINAEIRKSNTHLDRYKLLKRFLTVMSWNGTTIALIQSDEPLSMVRVVPILRVCLRLAKIWTTARFL